MTNILYICSANMGRSPALAAYTNMLADEYGIDIEADSAGSNPNALKPGRSYGTKVRERLKSEGFPEISSGRTKMFDPDEHGERADIILAADEANKSRVEKLLGYKIRTVGKYVDLVEPDIIDAHDSRRNKDDGPVEYKDGIMKDTPEAYDMMFNEIHMIAEKVVKKVGSNIIVTRI